MAEQCDDGNNLVWFTVLAQCNLYYLVLFLKHKWHALLELFKKKAQRSFVLFAGGRWMWSQLCHWAWLDLCVPGVKCTTVFWSLSNCWSRSESSRNAETFCCQASEAPSEQTKWDDFADFVGDLSFLFGDHRLSAFTAFPLFRLGNVAIITTVLSKYICLWVLWLLSFSGEVNTTALRCEPVCGDGLLVVGEACDDGNQEWSTIFSLGWKFSLKNHAFSFNHVVSKSWVGWPGFPSQLSKLCARSDAVQNSGDGCSQSCKVVPFSRVCVRWDGWSEMFRHVWTTVCFIAIAVASVVS